MEQDFYQQGVARAIAKDYQAAIQAFDQAIESSPDAAAYYNRGLARFNLGDTAWAIADFSTALRLEPDNYQIYFGRSLAYLSQGQTEAAIADAKQAIQRNSAHAAAHDLLGTAYQRLNQKDVAMTHYKKEAELYLDQKDADNGRRCIGHIQTLRSAPATVTPATKQAADYVPLHAQDFLKQAGEKAKQGNIASAMEDLDWAIRINAQDAFAYTQRAQVLSDLGDRTNAARDYEMAATLFAQQGNHEMQQLMLKQMQRLQSARSTSVIRLDQYRSQPHQGNPRKASSSTYISRKVQNKLMALVGYDRTIVIDLVEQLKLKNPGMPEDWYWEKAIYDLERDRH